MTNVLIVDHEFEKYIAYLEPRFPDVWFSCAENGDAAVPLIPDAEVLISLGRWLTPEIVEFATKLRWMQCIITGTDHLTAALSVRPDIILTNGRGIHGPQMTEITLLHMMALYRQVRRLTKNQERHIYDRFLPKVLETRKVAILGMGAIAEHMARVFSALGMTVTGISRTKRQFEGIDRIFLREEIFEAVADVDFLVVLVPYGPDTAKIVNSDVLNAMKPSACLINVARGGVVDETALIKALDQGTIAAAGLDVFDVTPLPDESRLWDMENVFITPFIGGRSDIYAEKVLTIIEPNLDHFIKGQLEAMINVVKR